MHRPEEVFYTTGVLCPFSGVLTASFSGADTPAGFESGAAIAKPAERGRNRNAPLQKSGTRESAASRTARRCWTQRTDWPKDRLLLFNGWTSVVVHHNRPPLELVAEKGDDDQE